VTASALALVVADDGAVDVLPDARRPHPATGQGWTGWAVALHDDLARRGVVGTEADVARVASWLRVQAVGCAALAVVEPRVDRYARLWTSAAAAAGMSVQVARRDGDRWMVEPVPDGPAIAAEPPRWQRPGRGYAARTWLTDRAEGLARRMVRAVQR
jgi:hypothetical protein